MKDLIFSRFSKHFLWLWLCFKDWWKLRPNEMSARKARVIAMTFSNMLSTKNSCEIIVSTSAIVISSIDTIQNILEIRG